ncbi:MAG: hypothetical protein MJ252_04895 [archaeon]|nr:hypothetical protein [archaeon]
MSSLMTEDFILSLEEQPIEKRKKQFKKISSLDDSSCSDIEDNKDVLCEPLNLLNLSVQSSEEDNASSSTKGKENGQESPISQTYSRGSHSPTETEYCIFAPSFSQFVCPTLPKYNFGIEAIDPIYFTIQVKTLNGSLSYQNMLAFLDQNQINILFAKIFPNLIEIMCCQYGNYFIQKFFMKLTYQQRQIVIQAIQPYFIQICNDRSGTHAIQALMKCLKYEDEKRAMDNLIKTNLSELITNENGIHIIQKVIIDIPEDERSYLNTFIINNLAKISENENGTLCIIKFIIMNKNPIVKLDLCKAIEKNFYCLLKNNNGCSVMLYALEKFDFSCCEFMFKEIKINLQKVLACKEYALNFIEKTFLLYKKIEHKNYNNYIWKLFYSEDFFKVLKQSQYGLIFISKIYKTLNEEQKNYIRIKF